MDTHLSHISAGPFPVYLNPIAPFEHFCHSPIAIFRVCCIDLINNTLDAVFFITDGNMPVVKACLIDAQKVGLSADTHPFIIRVNHIHAVFTGFSFGQIF